MSPSVGHRSPMRRENLSKSPVRARSSRRSPKSDRERSPHRSSHRDRDRDRDRVRVSPPPTKEREKEKPSSSSRGRSPKRPRSISPAVVRDRHRSREEHHKDRHREREVSIDRSSERRSARVKKEEDSLSMRSRSMRSASPMDRHREREVSGDRSSERRPTRVKKEEDSLSLRSRSKRSTSPMDRHREREVSVDRSSERRPARVKKEEDSSSLRSRSKRSTSPMDRDHSIRPTSGSPSRNSRSRGSRDEVASPRGDEHRDEKDSVAMMKAAEEALVAKKKEEPSFELSGKLAAETNRVRGVTLLFNEPPDARKPDIRWRLYVFKAGEVLNEPLYIHRQTCYLFGRERRVADIPTDHPSCSKQHAVIQFRQVEKEQLDGMLAKQVRPYLMDLGSTNGTFLNESRIESQRYYELFEKDTIKFGNSSREYVVLHENSAA